MSRRPTPAHLLQGSEEALLSLLSMSAVHLLSSSALCLLSSGDAFEAPWVLHGCVECSLS